MKQHYIVQSWESKQYVDLFRMALQGASYTEFYAAVAYATWGGVRVLDHILREGSDGQWNRVRKRWLVGIDWCRTDPSALSRLMALPSSAVRIPSGRFLVSRSGCNPATSYHPKLFLLRGKARSAIICGSGNLSINGLTKGCECGSLFLVNHPASDDAEGHSQLTRLLAWFRQAWRNASPVNSSLRAQYEQRCKHLLKQGKAVPTEDDASPPEPSPRRRGKTLSEEQVRALRTFDNLWIEASALGANLGHGRPGNQLDMTRYTRVFFGAALCDVPVNTVIDELTLVWDGHRYEGRTLRFCDNGIDKLNVPPAGSRGPLYYKNRTLLFTRQSDGTFAFVVGDRRQVTEWRRISRQRGLLHAMPGRKPREWGLF